MDFIHTINFPKGNREILERRIIEAFKKEFEEDGDFESEDFKEILNEVFECYDIEDITEIFTKLNINFIYYEGNMEGGNSITTNDFNFSIERRFQEESDHYAELAKMYTILANQNDYDLYIDSYC